MSVHSSPKLTCIDNHKTSRIVTKMGESDIFHCDFILIQKSESIAHKKVRKSEDELRNILCQPYFEMNLQENLQDTIL